MNVSPLVRANDEMVSSRRVCKELNLTRYQLLKLIMGSNKKLPPIKTSSTLSPEGAKTPMQWRLSDVIRFRDRFGDELATLRRGLKEPSAGAKKAVARVKERSAVWRAQREAEANTNALH